MLTSKITCIAKQSNEQSSTVRFAIEPETQNTAEGPRRIAKTAINISFADAVSADAYTIGKVYPITIGDPE